MFTPVRISTQDSPTPVQAEVVLDPTMQRVALGPFSSFRLADQAGQALVAEHGLASFLVMTKPGIKQGSLVLADDSASAADVISVLDAHGDKDFRLMKKPPYAGRVSLGYYRSAASVERRTAQLQNIGVEVEVVPRHQEMTQYWVELEASSDAELADLNLPGKEQQLVGGPSVP